MEQLQTKLSEAFGQMVEWRRHLHRHPELSFQEENTSAFIADLLEGWGLEVRRKVGGHGVVGVLRGAGRAEGDGVTVALRADIDALPIQDEKACEYASTVPGVMHACGHDAHTAALLGIARVMSEQKQSLPGTLVFLFQPAEEMSPGGAAAMIAGGVLDGVDAIYGVHLWTPFPSGSVYCAPGPIMASADEFFVEITGRGGHGGLPHQAVDSIMIGASVVTQLQTIVSRNIDPLEPSVLSIGSFHAGTSFNVIAETCNLTGTVRTFSEMVRNSIKQRIEDTVSAACIMHGASYHYDFKEGYPPVVNDAGEAERFFRVGAKLFEPEQVKLAPRLMAGEDFSYYLQRVPGCFMFVGAGKAEGGIVHPHHHPRFDIDEASMLQAAKLLLSMALDRMSG
ncbi:amidohydrolase [Paenibacillus sp. y28]|uniref:amidohydrolase n=1 Tax=Paenibacillus sp. y28 TaxID=3129110 RepID=UPI0030175FEC